MGSGLEAREVLEGHHDVYLHVHALLPGKQKHKQRCEIKAGKTVSYCSVSIK